MNNGIFKKLGFTLVELMIVIAIIALLMLVLRPRIGIIKNKARESGLRKNIEMLEGTIQSVIDDYSAGGNDVADALQIRALETRIARDINAASVDNQKLRNPVTGNLGAGAIASIATVAVVYSTTDDTDNGAGIDDVWTDGTMILPYSAGTVAYCAYVNETVTPHAINVRLIPFGVDNRRITELERVISQ